MLYRLLHILASGGLHTPQQLAQQLDVSEALLESMLDELVRMGYLKRLSATCCGNCDHCPLGSTCAVGTGGRVWELTETGRRLAQSDAQC